MVGKEYYVGRKGRRGKGAWLLSEEKEEPRDSGSAQREVSCRNVVGIRRLQM